MSKNNLQLYDDFHPATSADWRKAAEQLLKGKPFETLLTETYENIRLQPIYSARDTANLTSDLTGLMPVSNTEGHTWEVAQELPYKTPAEFNRALLTDLQHGQTAVNLVTRFTRISSLADLETALAGVDLAHTPLFIEAGNSGLEILELFTDFCKKQRFDLKSVRGAICTDPLAELARNGRLNVKEEDFFCELKKSTENAKAAAPNLRTIGVDTNPYHDGGASAVQELACALAASIAYLRKLLSPETGLAVSDLVTKMRFSFAVSSDFFMQVAKLRAARLLWAQVVKEFGGDENAGKLFIHVRTSARNKTIVDAHTNILRTTTEAFAAICGGCDSLHVAPFDVCFRPPNEFSRRIARNIQLILRYEAHLNAVQDPGSGSWYIEHLTNELAEKAWAYFQKIERRGGMLQALKDNFIQNEIAETAKRRAENLASGKEKIVGVTSFRNEKEKLPKSAKFAEKMVSTEQFDSSSGYIEIVPLKPVRDAEPFEK